MKLSMRLFLFLVAFALLFMTTGFGLFYQPTYEENIKEEAIPIRTAEVTTGLSYTITIGKRVQDKTIVLSSHILDSVLHYQDISMINHFFVQLEIKNYTSSSYLLKNISIVDTTTNVVIEDIPYVDNQNNVFSFYLEQSFFQKYKKEYVAFIELEK